MRKSHATKVARLRKGTLIGGKSKQGPALETPAGRRITQEAIRLQTQQSGISRCLATASFGQSIDDWFKDELGNLVAVSSETLPQLRRQLTHSEKWHKGSIILSQPLQLIEETVGKPFMVGQSCCNINRKESSSTPGDLIQHCVTNVVWQFSTSARSTSRVCKIRFNRRRNATWNPFVLLSIIPPWHRQQVRLMCMTCVPR